MVALCRMTIIIQVLKNKDLLVFLQTYFKTSYLPYRSISSSCFFQKTKISNLLN